jgi:hypothetical protein
VKVGDNRPLKNRLFFRMTHVSTPTCCITCSVQFYPQSPQRASRSCLAPDLFGVAHDVSLVPRHLSHSVNYSGLSLSRNIENYDPFYFDTQPNRNLSSASQVSTQSSYLSTWELTHSLLIQTSKNTTEDETQLWPTRMQKFRMYLTASEDIV